MVDEDTGQRGNEAKREMMIGFVMNWKSQMLDRDARG